MTPPIRSVFHLHLMTVLWWIHVLTLKTHKSYRCSTISVQRQWWSRFQSNFYRVKQMRSFVFVHEYTFTCKYLLQPTLSQWFALEHSVALSCMYLEFFGSNFGFYFWLYHLLMEQSPDFSLVWLKLAEEIMNEWFFVIRIQSFDRKNTCIIIV